MIFAELPWWVEVFFVLYVAVNSWGLSTQIRDNGVFHWTVLLDVITELCLLYSAFCYWFESFATASMALRQGILAMGVLGLLIIVVHAIRNAMPEEDLPLPVKFGIALGSIAVIVPLYAPVIYWGSLSAFAGLHFSG